MKNIKEKATAPKYTYYLVKVVVKDLTTRNKVYLAERLYGLEEHRRDKILKSIKEDQKLFEDELIKVFPFEIINSNQGYTFERINRFTVDDFWLTPANETLNKSFRSRAIINKLISIRKEGKQNGNI